MGMLEAILCGLYVSLLSAEVRCEKMSRLNDSTFLFEGESRKKRDI